MVNSKWFSPSLVLLILLTFSVFAEEAHSDAGVKLDGTFKQEPVDEPSWIDNFLDNLGADGEFDPDKLIDFSFLPGPFYNPEMDLGIGLSAIGLYRVDPNDELTQLSSLVINGFASTNGALGVTVANKTFLHQDQRRFYLDAEIADAPDVFYGVGYQDNYDDGNRSDFNNRQFSLRPMWLERLSETSFIGAGFDFSYAQASNIDLLESDIETEILEKDSRSVGINIMINYDTRDTVLNPSKGRILQLDAAWYRQALGGKTDFESQSFLYSEYLPVGNSGDVIAWQLHGRFTQGDVPWDKLSKLGGGSHLRGYTSGRYRDKQMLLTQAEYRLNLPGRHGMVFWAGAGTIASEISEFSADELLPNVGIGYRFEVKPNVNLRLDMGFGDGDSGFYFNVNEAF
ncbi:outer membrane protein assembly factor [Shewanella eurypsychrophilus]|uniref:Outer membrane protein assembly factor n=1 Tax=Shewanella eurypsychrophilus TaxID=2593656 RepID=A0ABX6VBB6_9GAMM|nr:MULTISPECIES: BamA/TamA family outer membrane protein [Shewanella]QFU24714.1 BamA/TamA family outer membrane protein [Shewanella sp. YLB-09]QPG59907.1 outer membrane protein assembly factor [Shewanella eurypsychrophilus]